MRLNEVISIQPGFKYAVDILEDLYNEDKIRAYIPTENGVKVIEQVFDYIIPTTITPPIILTGTYGTGKSHLGLVLTTMLCREESDDTYQELLKKIKRKWPKIGEKIEEIKRDYGNKPYLLVYLEGEEVDWGKGFFDSSLALALKRALKREGLEDLIPHTAYDRAVERINELKKYPDAYDRLEREIAANGYSSIEDLINKLDNHNKKALNDFGKIHRLVCFGAEFDVFSGISASELYPSVVEALKERGYNGILLIWDEFTPVIRFLVEDPESEEALNFQKFAQTCESSIGKIIALFISHRDIREVIDIVMMETFKGTSITKGAEKIAGRFKVMSLGYIDRETYHLMKGIIIHNEQFNSILLRHNGIFLNIEISLEELKLFQSFNEEDRKVLIEDLYPLHPLTTLLLSYLTGKVGQRDRTIFTFLCDSGEGTFKDFLSKHEVTQDDLPFLYPYELITYFLPLIRTNQDYKELRKLAKKYEDIIESYINDALANKVIKTIFLLNAGGVLSTTEYIIFALGAYTESKKSEIRQKLTELKQQKILTRRISDNSWRFYGLGLDVAMDDHILEILPEIERRISVKDMFNLAFEEINIKDPYRTITADNYNIDRELDRKVEIKAISVRELENPNDLRERIQKNYLDGGYYLVLADTEEDYKLALEKIQNEFKNDSNIIFALPSNASVLNEIIPQLKRWKALEELPAKYPQYQSELREEHLTELDDVKTYLKKKLETLLDPINGYLEFYVKGRKEDINSLSQFRQLVSRIMEDTFPYTPCISRGELVTDTGKDTFKKYRIPIIDTLLTPNAPVLLANESDKVKQSIIESIYRYHNILRKENGVWIFGKPKESPQNNAMIKVWDKIDSFVRSQHDRDISELIEELLLPPYGLKLRTVSLIFAAVIRDYILNNNLIFNIKGEPKEKIDGEFIDQIIMKRKPKTVYVKYQEISEKHRMISEVVGEIFGSEHSDLDSVAKSVILWWNKLPQYSRITQNVSENVKRLRDEFFEPLSAQDRDKKELFYSVLPDLVGLDNLNVASEDEIKKKVTEMLVGVKKELEEQLANLHKKIKETVFQIWGEGRELIKYYKNLPEDTKVAVFSGDARKVMKWLRDLSTKKEINTKDFVFLAEEILGKCENWNDDQVNILYGRLQGAKEVIDGYVAPKPQPTITKDLKHPDKKTIYEESLVELRVGEFMRKFKLYKDLSKTPNKKQVQIIYGFLKSSLIDNLKNNQIDYNEFLSIIYHLIREAENA